MDIKIWVCRSGGDISDLGYVLSSSFCFVSFKVPDPDRWLSHNFYSDDVFRNFRGCLPKALVETFGAVVLDAVMDLGFCSTDLWVDSMWFRGVASSDS